MASQPSQERIASHGRGGAGNIAKDDPTARPQAADLVTPTLKSEHYTTGRGGTGNMARNDPNHPEIARASQDVDPPVHRENEGPHHFGRGGAANVVGPSEEEKRKAHENNQPQSADMQRETSPSSKGIVEKGKEFIHKLGSKK